MSRQLNLDTNVGHNRRYSFLQTPLEMHAPGLHPPASVGPLPSQQHLPQPQLEPVTVQEQATSSAADEKAQHLQNDPVVSPYASGSPPPPEQHPANYAPFADEMTQAQPQPLQPQQLQPYEEAPQYTRELVPHSPGPLPIKTSTTPPDQHRPVDVAPDTNPLHSPLFPRFPPPTATSTSPVPVPEDITAYHQPGQVRHPDQVIKGGTWSHSLCDCSNIGTCCMGIFCPCILYGKTQHRLALKSKKEDPTNMLGYDTCNEHCTAMAVLCGCQWLMATIQHTRTRKAYRIPGDVLSDCVRATCCTCCTLIQDETEIMKREEERARLATAQGATLTSPYMAPVQMTYPPPPR